MTSSHVVYRKQCDEDDYGFASKTSQVGFLKLGQKRDEGLFESGFVWEAYEQIWGRPRRPHGQIQQSTAKGELRMEPKKKQILSKSSTQVKKDLSSAKERVKEALKREQEERNGPRKRRFVLLIQAVLLNLVL